jgi:tRNA A37 methylthiotransferase MiaB
VKVQDNCNNSCSYCTRYLKKERVNEIVELSANKKKKPMKRYVNKDLDVLIESVNKDGICRGTSGNYLKVPVYSNKISKGSIVDVNIRGLQDDNMLHGVLA